MPRPIHRFYALLHRLAVHLDLGVVSRWVLFASVIGVLAGLVGYGFEWLIHFMKVWLLQKPTGVKTEGIPELTSNWWLFLAIPAAGGLVTGWLTQKIAPEVEGHGTDNVIKAFHRMRGKVRTRVILLKALTSAITIGSGGSAGKEGPVAQVGSGVGSALADGMKLSSRDRRIFLLAGASAGIGAMFSAPLGGALFMPEVIYRKAEFEGDAIIPCVIASITAYTTYTVLTGGQQAVPLDPEILKTLAFHPSHIWVYLVLALICTAFGWLYTRTFYGIHGAFKKMTAVPPMLRPAIGGLLLGATAILLSTFAGEHGIFHGGYGLIESSISGSITIQVLFALVIFKILATSFSISSGGSGGVFAPSLAIGALLGAMVGQSVEWLMPDTQLVAACTLVGMGGFFAGVAKVPIASVIMVSEMTGSYALLAPLMLVAVIHMMLSNRWSLYEAQVNGQVDSPAHHGDFVIDVLGDIKVSDILHEIRDPHCLNQRTTLRAVLRHVAHAKESVFPIVDDDGFLVGIFSLTDVRRIYLEDVVEDMVIVRDFMKEDVTCTHMNAGLDVVLRQFTAANVNTIPVVEGEGDKRRVLALLERNEVGRAYNRRLQELKDDEGE